MTRSTAKTWSDVGASLALLIAVCIITQGCERSKPPPSSLSQPPAADGAPWFVEIAQQSGLVFEWRSGFRDRRYMPEITGGGAALFDMDGDGDLDAYLVQAGSLVEPKRTQPPNQLFRNLGDGAFENVTSGSGADDSGYGMGVACGDYDNDGDVDLYVTNVGPNVLLQNDGTGRFTDVTTRAGVGHSGWGSSAAFVDYDHDGDLDLYVCNYLNWAAATEVDCFNAMGAPDYCLPQNYNAPAVDVLYRNNGDGTFADVTEQAGLNQTFGTGLGVVCGDFNNDGWIDIFVANDLMPDRLWLNQGNGTFRDEALFAGCAIDQEGQAKAGMGVTAADIDDDGDLDLLVCNLAKQSDSYFINEGGYFTDSTAMMGLGAVSRPFTRFGMAWIDFDHDGDLDLYQVNGRVARQSMVFSDDPYAEPNLLFQGLGGGRFKEFRPRGGTRELLAATSRAAAFGDIDQDGAIDVLVVNRDAKAHLLHNIVPNRGNWISFRVIEEHGRDALGATVRLTLGNRRITRDVRAAYSFLASNDPKVHVGLGERDTATDVSVRWINGGIESFGDFGANQVVTLQRGDG
ncbi:MAG: CRTAC1 family protein [Planctomycetes bacterium]|nr:CRTAC1 family protein [Planctomycetota bacterium]